MILLSQELKIKEINKNAKKILNISDEDISEFDGKEILKQLSFENIEKGKERKYIDIFVKTIISFPYEMYSEYVKIALKYYMCKYAIHTLTKQENLNSIFNRNTKENILLIY